MKKTFKKLKPLDSTIIGCLNCGHTPGILKLNTRLYHGFGGWSIYKDGTLIFQDDSDKEWHEYKTLMFIENKAKLKPNCDWRAKIFLPLREAEYQRQDGKWILVKTGMGFA